MSQVARQRARPVRGDRALRHRRAALLLLPRGLVRPGRLGLDGRRSRRATRASWRTSYGNLASRTLAMIARYRDGVVPEAAVDPALARDFDGLADEVAALLDRAELTPGARGDLAARAAAQPLRRGARAVAAGQGPGAGRRARRDARARSPRGCARSPCCCTRTCRRATAKLLAALGATDELGYARRGARGGRLGRRGDDARAAVPKPHDGRRDDRQPHAPRPRASRRPSELVAAAEQVGVRRMLTVGTDARLVPRRARGSPRTSRRCTSRSAATRTTRPASTTPTSPSCRRSPRTRAAARSARPGSTSTATTRPREDQERAFAAQIAARARDRQAARDPHARGRRRHARDARRPGGGPARDPALLLDARPARRVPRARLLDLVRRQRHLPANARDLRVAARERPRRAPAGRDRRAVPDAAGRAQGAQPAGERGAARPSCVAAERGVAYEELEAQVERNAAELFGW